MHHLRARGIDDDGWAIPGWRICLTLSAQRPCHRFNVSDWSANPIGNTSGERFCGSFGRRPG